MIKEVLDYLDELYPNPKCELEYNKDYELYFIIDTPLNIEFEKQYEIEELNEYLVSFKDVEDEEKNCDDRALAGGAGLLPGAA